MKTHIQVPKPPPVLRIAPGARVHHNGQAATVLAVYGADRILLQLQHTRTSVETSAEALCTGGPNGGAVVIAHPIDADPVLEAKAKTWTAALARLPARSSKLEKTRIAEAISVSVRTVYRRLRKFREDPSVTGQLDAPPGPLRGSRRLGAVREEIFERAYNERYLTREKPSIKALHKHIRRVCARAHVPALSYHAVRDRVRAKNRLRADEARLGWHQAHATQAPAVGALKAKQALSDVQIDHVLCDLQVTSELDGKVIGRPWITLAIDVFTRCVLGFYLGLEDPNQTSVALCLARAIFPKGEWLRTLGEDVDYPMFGKFDRMHWDNAKTFQAGGIATQCERYGIELVPRPPRCPHYGAYIERYAGTLMGAMHNLPGTTFSNVKQKGDYDSEARACMTMPALERWILHQVCGVYHNEEHRGLGGISPATAWRLAWEMPDGELRLPPLISDRREFVCGLLPFEERCVRRDGISLFGIHYWDPILAPLINDGTKYRVHYHQGNMGVIHLCWRGQYLDVPLRDRTRRPFARWELDDARRLLKSHHNKAASESALFHTLDQQDRIVDESAAHSRRARRKQALRPRPADGPPPTVPDYGRPAIPPTARWEDEP